MRTIRLRYAAIAVALSLVASPVMADYLIKDGQQSLQTVFAFTCQLFKVCTANVIVDSTGTEKATATNPLIISQYGLTPANANQNNVAIATATGLTIPSGSTYAVIQAIGGTAYITYDGSTPSSSNYSKYLLQGNTIGVSGINALNSVKIIGVNMGVDYWH